MKKTESSSWEMMHKANDGIFILDIKTGKILSANKRSSEITGRAIAELINLHPGDISSQNPGYTSADAILHIRKTEKNKTLSCDWECRRKNGKVFWVEVSLIYTSIEKKDRIVVFFHEIQERKKTEQALQKSEANLRAIFDHTDNGFILLDTSFNVLSFNIVAYEWSVLSFGAYIEEGVSLLRLISNDRKSESIGYLNEILQGKSIRKEVEYPDINGSTAWYLVRMNPVFEKDGVIIGLCISASDITARKLAELERTQIINDLVKHNKDLEQFAYIVSHNLRAPVANILGITDLMQNARLSKQEEKEMIGDLTISVNRLDNVIKDLNYVLQIKREVTEKKEIVKFSKIVKDIKASVANLVKTENAKIVCDFSKVNEMLTLKSYLYSVFFNLISNGIKYRRPDICPVIEITSAQINNKIILVFKDNGLGIDLNKKRDQVFGLYKRFHNHTEGKGMGLYMTRIQVEMMGGNISVASEVNNGSEFTMEFENN